MKINIQHINELCFSKLIKIPRWEVVLSKFCLNYADTYNSSIVIQKINLILNLVKASSSNNANSAFV